MGTFGVKRLVHATICLCITIGVALNIAALVNTFMARPQQVAMWYNVPLCDSGNSIFVSTEGSSLSASSVCTGSGETGVLFNVDSELFEPGLQYTAFTMRTKGTQVFTTATAPDRQPYISLDAPGYFSASSRDDARRRLEAEDDQAAAPQRSARRLLKGGAGGGGGGGSSYSSGSTYVSRSGSYNSWGGSVTVRGNTRSGLSTVSPGTTVVVYSRAPFVTSRTQSSPASSQCQDTSRGCEYLTTSSLQKDEWVGKTPFVINPNLPLTLNVTAAIKFTETSYPKLFVGFVTDETMPQTAAAGLLAIVAAVFACGIPGLLCWLPTKWPAMRRAMNGGSTSSPGYTPVRNNSVASVAAVSVDPMPLPAAIQPKTGQRYTRIDGDHRSLHEFANSSYSGLQVASNDIASLAGCELMAQLEVLDATNNNVISLQGLSSSSLRQLVLNDNDVSTLEGAQGAPSLEWLSLHNNSVYTLGLTAQLPSLRYLNIASNDLTSLAGLEMLPGLTHLDAANNDISDISALQELRQLQVANLAQNEIKDGSPLAAIAQSTATLTWVNIKGNNMPAMRIQEVRDAFGARATQCTLLS